MDFLQQELLLCLLSLITAALTQDGGGSGDDMSLVPLYPSSSSSILSEDTSASYGESVLLPSNPSVSYVLSSSAFVSSISSTPASIQVTSLPSATILPSPSSDSSRSSELTPLTSELPALLSVTGSFPTHISSSEFVLTSSPSPLVPSISPPPSSESTSTGAPIGGFPIGAISGAAAGGVLVVLVIVLFIVAAVCIVAKRRKKSGKQTISAEKDFMMVTSPKDDEPYVSPTSTDDKLQHFGFGTDTFGITNFPDTPAPTNGQDLPALVFINPVDPNIPVSSNTLPLRGKLRVNKRSEGDLKTHFNFSGLSRESVRGHRSMGSLDKVGIGSTDPLTTDISLHELTRDKTKNSSYERNENIPNDSNNYEETSVKETRPCDIISRPSDGYGYLFRESSSKEDMKVSTFVGFDDSSSNHDAPEKAVVVSKMESSSKLEHTAPDRSHYDVPRKVLEEARARANKKEEENKKDVKEATKLYDGDEVKKDSTDSSDQTDSVLHNNVEEEKKIQTSRDDGTAPAASTSVNTSIKHEGIYDVPRSILAESSADSSGAALHVKLSKPPVRVKPKIAPRAPTTKLSSSALKDMLEKSTNSCVTAGDSAENNMASIVEAIQKTGNSAGEDTRDNDSISEPKKHAGNDAAGSTTDIESKAADLAGSIAATNDSKIRKHSESVESSTKISSSISSDSAKNEENSLETNASVEKETPKITEALDSSSKISKAHVEPVREAKHSEKLKPPDKPQVMPRTKESLQSPKAGRPSKPPVARKKPALLPRRTSVQST